MNTPIVLVHSPYSWYIDYTLLQAYRMSGEETYLLGDRNNKINCKHIYFLDTGQTEKTEQTEQLIKSYVHRSTNSNKLELFCMLRWFHMLEFMKKKHIDRAFYMDSDVLVYSKIEEIERIHDLKSAACAYMIPDQYHSLHICASGHFSYWTIDTLREFCDFMLLNYQDEAYIKLHKEKWAYHQAHNLAGGVCDMTVLYLFAQEKNKSQNLCLVKEGTVIDENFNTGTNYKKDEFLVENGKKKVIWKGKQPYFVSKEGKEIKAHTLHMQGQAKMYIPKYYRGDKQMITKKAHKDYYIQYAKIHTYRFLQSIKSIFRL